MKSYFANLNRGCYNYIEEKVANGKVDIIQKGPFYYHLTNAPRIDAIIGYHEINTVEVYDKIAKLINIHFVSCISILKSNLIDNGPSEVDLSFNGSAVVRLKSTCVVINPITISICPSLYGPIFFRTDSYISKEIFNRLFEMTRETLKQIDDIWLTIQVNAFWLMGS